MKNPLRRTFLPFVLAAGLLVGLGCSFPYQSVGPIGPQQPVEDELMQRADASLWVQRIQQLSGFEPVTIGGETTTIETRASRAMFSGQPDARAFEFVQEQAHLLAPYAQIEVDPYPSPDGAGEWRNLIVTLPGATHPEEVVVVSAHLDDTSVKDGDPLVRAPGADDNGTGVATLLEALRLLYSYRYERTLRFVFFTGEEDGLAGSTAYLQDHPAEEIKADLNLDMFGYDGDGDHCFELHVGMQPGSDAIGQVFTKVIADYGLVLRYDYLTTDATQRSDHAAFWAQGIPAMTVMENLLSNGQEAGCLDSDFNPYYHQTTDTLDKLDLEFGFSIARAAIVTAAELAKPVPRFP